MTHANASTDPLAAEYLQILTDHGRRVANRWLFARQTPQKPRLCDFYAMYGREDVLPEHERARTSLIDSFDPQGFHAFYADTPAPSPHPADI